MRLPTVTGSSQNGYTINIIIKLKKMFEKNTCRIFYSFSQNFRPLDSGKSSTGLLVISKINCQSFEGGQEVTDIEGLRLSSQIAFKEFDTQLENNVIGH